MVSLRQRVYEEKFEKRGSQGTEIEWYQLDKAKKRLNEIILS